MKHNRFSTMTEDEVRRAHGHKRGAQKHKKGGHGRSLFEIEEKSPNFVYKKPGEWGIDWRKKGVHTKVTTLGQCSDPAVFQAIDELTMAH